MTNEKFILRKKKEKFNLAWEKLLRILPSSGQKALEISGMTFQKRNVGHRQDYIICNKVGTTKGASYEATKVVLGKSDLENAFVGYEDYDREIIEAKRNLSGDEFNVNGVPITFHKKKSRIREYGRLENEQRYFNTLLAKCGCSLKKEREIDNLQIENLSDYIKSMKSIGKISSFYFEFKSYGLKHLYNILKTRKKIEDILVSSEYSDFREFCLSNGITSIFDILVFPFYSKTIVNRFGYEILDSIIKNIKGTIDLLLLEDDGIDMLDIEDFE